MWCWYVSIDVGWTTGSGKEREKRRRKRRWDNNNAIKNIKNYTYPLAWCFLEVFSEHTRAVRIHDCAHGTGRLQCAERANILLCGYQKSCTTNVSISY